MSYLHTFSYPPSPQQAAMITKIIIYGYIIIIMLFLCQQFRCCTYNVIPILLLHLIMIDLLQLCVTNHEEYVDYQTEGNIIIPFLTHARLYITEDTRLWCEQNINNNNISSPSPSIKHLLSLSPHLFLSLIHTHLLHLRHFLVMHVIMLFLEIITSIHYH